MIICQAIYSTNFIDINPSKKYSIKNKYVYMIASGKYMIRNINECLSVSQNIKYINSIQFYWVRKED